MFYAGGKRTRYRSPMDIPLNATEQHELLAFLQALLSFPTEDPPGREIDLARFLYTTLRDWGLDAELDEFSPGRANVLARLGTGDGPGLAFSAHLDTLPAGTQPWTYPPFAGECHGGRIYGRGAADMKGGLAAMAFAARRLHRAGAALPGPLMLAFSAGESSSCLGAKRMVARGDLQGIGALLISEPSGLDVLIAETGALWLTVSARGSSGHVSAGGAAANAVLAVVEAARRLQQLQLQGPCHPLLGSPVLRINTIAGGSAINLNPDYAELGVDIRYPPGMQREQLLAQVTEHLGEQYQLTVVDDKPPVQIDAAHPFVDHCLAACRATLGDTPPPAGVSYFSDATVLSTQLGLPRVVIGPGELGMSGQHDEWVAVDKLVAAVEIYTRVASNWVG